MAKKESNQPAAEEIIFKKLAVYLNDLPAGFPATDSGVEMRILKRLFTAEEAALALHVTLIPEPAHVVAHRAGLKPAEAKEQLERMALRGLVYSIESKSKPTEYMVNQFVIGIWEYHVNDLDKELITDMNEYIPALMEEAWKIPQLRTIPVNQSIDAQLEVTTYERAEELIRQQWKIVVAPCICRRERTMMGEGCQAPEEACLVFGKAGDYYLRNGMGREISKAEALDILVKADEAGLVLQPSNSQRAANICCCCGCCCAVLRTIRKHPRPVDLVSSPFTAINNPDTCEGCGSCLDRCQVDALSLDSGVAEVIVARCIGCGLCVTTCPSESLHLERKPEDQQPEIPKSNTEKYIKLAWKRGKLSPAKLAVMQIKSKFDRLVASKKM